jgi:ribosomal protein L16/L10AE
MKSPDILDNPAILSRSTPSPEVSEQQVEAARYAVLRRLSPALRHHMVRHLQPIGLIYGVMDHKLARGEPDVQALRANADKINESNG